MTRSAGQARVLFVVLVALVAGPTAVVGQAGGAAACEDPDADPWVGEMRDRSIDFSGMVAYAMERFGLPISCQGAVTMEFDGGKYGELELQFPGGVFYQVETMPLETSIVTLGAPMGFADEEAARLLLREYATGIGLDIDWEAPEEVVDAGERILTFWDHEPGLNASAQLIYRETALVAVRLRMAL